jgi:hypothetical protein
VLIGLVDGDVPAAAGTSAADRGPSTITMRSELESFRRAQGAAYWHHDRRAG